MTHLFSVTFTQNHYVFYPYQVQQLEKGSPGKLKVVAKSTEGPETIEGVYNTVSCYFISSKWVNTLIN